MYKVREHDFSGIFAEKLWLIHWLANLTQAAGRGFTTGKTAQDDEVQVLNPDEDLPCADSVLRCKLSVEFHRNLSKQIGEQLIRQLIVLVTELKSFDFRTSITYQTGSQPARALPRGLPASMMPVTFLEKYGKNWSSLTWSHFQHPTTVLCIHHFLWTTVPSIYIWIYRII